MDFGIGGGELAWLVVVIVVAGITSGLLAGLFGVGGGAVVVPVLYEVFGLFGVPEAVLMQLCVGTSLAIMAPTTIRSYLAHRAKGIATDDVLRRWMVPTIVGVGVGSILAVFAPSALFRSAFAVIATFISFKLLFGRANWVISHDLPGRTLMSVYGFIIGLCSSLMGVSGGSLSNFILTLYGRPIHQAVAIAAGITVPIALAGTVGYALAGLPHQAMLPPFSVGYVSLVALAVIAPLSTWTAPYGARLAHWLPKRKLEIAFGCFLLLAASRFIVSMVW
jgi:uncharacterized membrane protein YfcA